MIDSGEKGLLDVIRERIPTPVKQVVRFVRSATERQDLIHEWSRRRGGEPPLPSPPIERVVVICHGNICRSPFAGVDLERRIPHIAVRSAGLAAGPGNPAEPGAIRVGQEFGLDLGEHRSSPLSDADVEWGRSHHRDAGPTQGGGLPPLAARREQGPAARRSSLEPAPSARGPMGLRGCGCSDRSSSASRAPTSDSRRGSPATKANEPVPSASIAQVGPSPRASITLSRRRPARRPCVGSVRRRAARSRATGHCSAPTRCGTSGASSSRLLG